MALSPSALFTAAVIAANLLAAIFLASCGGEKKLERSRLLDPLQPPEVLTETRILDFLPAQSATRFVSGWWGWREDGVLRMVPYTERARIEVATLQPRKRTLRFLTKVHQLPAEGSVEVRIDGELVAELPLDPAEVELPPLPIGRYPVDLLWPAGSEVGIEKAELEQALPAGQVRIDEETVSQSGFSAVDFVRWLPAGARLSGQFSPPVKARAQQAFRIVIESEGQPPKTVFEWPAPWWRRWRRHRFDIELGSTEGLVRIRFAADGTGEAATWAGLALELPVTPATSQKQQPEPPPPPKLVLLYVLDALRADFVGHLGGSAATPTLDRLAAEGVSFRNHQSLAPNTLPSTKTLFTGRPVLTSNRQRLSPAGPPLLAELFQHAGYRTALLSGNGYVSDFYGVTRGFEHLDRSVLYDFHPRGDYNDNAEWVHPAASEWLESQPPNNNLFLYVHVVHPHNPYQPPPAFTPPELAAVASTIAGDTDTLVAMRKGEVETSAADRERLALLYRGSVEYGDAQLGELLQHTVERYQPGEVLVLVTSDHGEELFDHDGVLHGLTLYQDQLSIPLIAWWPGVLPARSVTTATTIQDLYVTLRQLTGDYQPPALGGRSLWPLLLGDNLEQGDSGERVRFAAAPGVEGGIYSAQSRRRKLIWAPRKGSQWGMGDGPGRSHEAEYVFDLVADPSELNNLAGEPSLETDWLRSQLNAWIELGHALQPGSEDAQLDDATQRNLEALGYLN